MRAVQYVQFGRGPELVEVDRPVPGPGQIRLRVTASGLCHSDETIMSIDPEVLALALPMTLGHEPAGVVDELGDGVQGVEIGDRVIVYGCWGCGVCEACADGWENLCPNGRTSPGLGTHGAMADYMIVDDVRHLVAIGDLHPVAAASLTDAALTPYQAIKSIQPRLSASSTTVVIGVGGLGHVAIQLLRLLSATRVVAVDLDEDSLALASDRGAHETLISSSGTATEIRRLTGGRGADVILDFVGTDSTGAVAMAGVRSAGAVVLVGAGQGVAHVGLLSSPFNVTVSTSLWGRRAQLLELVELAHRGLVSIQTTTYPLSEALSAYRDLREGRVRGRAVVVP